jgi:hypothetical protein
MRFQLTPLGPVIGVVVMIDIAQQEAGLGFMNNQAEISAHTD